MSQEPGGGRGENAFLAWLRESDRPSGRLEVPVGDDAAVWRLDDGTRLVLAADALAEGSHFDAGTPPELIGRKALAVNLSDLAAMGAEPLCALATCALPRGFDLADARAITGGLRALGVEFACPLVGGDTVTHEGGVVLSVSVIGTAPRGVVTRGGAGIGDRIAITGAVGGSRGGRHLRFTPRLEEARRLMDLGPPSAMMDVSDGLLLDLSRLADASGVGFRLEADRVPLHVDLGDGVKARRREALAEGEDFELIFTAPADGMERIVRGWQHETPLTVIGEIVDSERTLVIDGAAEEARPLGYEHG